ncbi:MAG TPA: hypothetical protein VF889_07935, partial [Bacteroidota bacterium]
MDIDVRQWRALVRTSFRIIRRQPSSFSLGGRSAGGGLWAGVVIYVLMGVLFAFLASQAAAPDTAAFLL